jgi:hypothetical protein
MSLTRSPIPLGVVLGCWLAAAPAHANWVKKLSKSAAAGAAEGIQPVLANTLADVDRRVAVHEERLGNITERVLGKASSEIGVRLDQVDGIVEKRLLQVQLGAEDIIDHGLSSIDRVAEKRLNQIDLVLAARIGQVDAATQNALDKVDGILEARTADVGRVVLDAVDRADGALAARLEQVDEIAGRRLGNVDVIATKQRLGLERTVVRTAWIVGIIVFVALVLRRLWVEYVEKEKEILAAKAGPDRLWRYITQLGKPLLRQGLVAAVAALVLWQVPDRLPMAAKKDAEALLGQHTRALEQAYRQQDWTAVRFHASQLDYLEPSDGTRYRVLAAKAELLRDVLGRPTALQTPKGVAAVLKQVRHVERLLEGRADPDVLMVRAAALWRSGTTKTDEHRAASLAAQALRASPRGFVLSGLARGLVQAYLHAPAPSGEPPELESEEGLRATLSLAPPDPDAALEGPVVLLEHMHRLEEASTAGFLAMVRAQAEVLKLVRQREPEAAVSQARQRRTELAQGVVDAWTEFDLALRSLPVLEDSAVVLAVFRLNDVPLTHALWFTAQPTTNQSPVALSTLSAQRKDPARLALALKIAPARVVWARRYADLLDGPARELVELQEAQRFEWMEKETLEFEAAWTQVLIGDVTPAPKAQGARQPVASTRPAWQAATSAAGLGLYTTEKGERRPLASSIAKDLDEARARLAEELQVAKRQARTAVAATSPKPQSAIDDAVRSALVELEKKLQSRGPQLI